MAAGTVLAMTQFEWFLAALLVVRPLLDGINPGQGERTLAPSSAVGVLFIAASLVWLAGRGRSGLLVPPSPLTAGLGVLVTAAALSCLVSPSPSVSIAALLRLLSAALMFVVIEQLLASRPEYVHRLLGATFAAAGLVCTWTVLQLFLAPPIDEYTGQLRLQGPFHHPNVLAKFLVVVLLALVGLALSHRGARRLAALVATIPVAVLLGLTFTRVAWIAAVLGVAYLVGKRHRLLVPVLIAGVLAISTIPAVTSRIDDLWRPEPVNGVPGNSLVWRFDYWRQLVPLWRRSPLNGIGLEVIPTVAGPELPGAQRVGAGHC